MKIFPTAQRNSMRPRARGFTIVETLVAITILMIAIAGPLVVATKGLTSALYAKDQMIATFLAQESMEVIKNIRDNNLLDDGSDWLQVNESFNMSACTIDNPCDASAVGDAEEGFVISFGLNGEYPLTFDSSGYRYDPTGVPGQFTRFFYFDIPTLQTVDTEVRLHVIVNWYEGTVPYQVDLTSQLVNTIR